MGGGLDSAPPLLLMVGGEAFRAHLGSPIGAGPFHLAVPVSRAHLAGQFGWPIWPVPMAPWLEDDEPMDPWALGFETRGLRLMGNWLEEEEEEALECRGGSLRP